MKLSDFDYQVPQDRIAQYPLTDRTAAKLLVLDRARQRLEHRSFRDIVRYLGPGDVLVFNNTKVMPARILARKQTGGSLEILLVKERAANAWDCLIKPARRLKRGIRVQLANGMEAEIGERDTDYYQVRFLADRNILSWLDEIGTLPLPPYIKRPVEAIDREYYQTVYAERAGSIAAPTAGLHFTAALIAEIEARGAAAARITLSIGPGTFLPIRTEEVDQHRMAAEYYEIGIRAQGLIENAKRVVAVGTSSVRTLETAAGQRRIIRPRGWSELFIYPGHKFNLVDGLVTNFHLPKATPLLLTAAFAGRELLLRAYHEAIQSNYRFFSYGDAMLII